MVRAELVRFVIASLELCLAAGLHRRVPRSSHHVQDDLRDAV